MLSRFTTVLCLAAAALAVVPAAGGGARDDTDALQARLDAGGTVFLPKLPGGQCYATRGLWVSRDDTEIGSDGACITSLGPGPVRLTSPDGDPIPAQAVFYINRSGLRELAPVNVSIHGLRIDVPPDAGTYGIGIFGHEVTVQDVTVTGSPLDAITIGGRANGDGYAGRVAVLNCTLTGGRRNVVSATSVIGLRIEGNRITGSTDTWPSPGGGNPGAGIDLEPDQRGTPMLDVLISGNTIADNAGPGIIVSLGTNRGNAVIASAIRIVGNTITGNGTKPTPPEQGGILFKGGQDRARTGILVERNTITGNRGAGLTGHDTTVTLFARGNVLDGNELGPFAGVRFGIEH